MTKRRPDQPLRVALFTPDTNGGIGRLVPYLVNELKGSPEVEVSVYYTRGKYHHPIFSVFHLSRGLLHLIAGALFHRVDVIHINLSQAGSTIRKSILAFVARKLRVPTVLHLHASGYDAFYARRRKVTQRIIRRVFNRTSYFLVLGERWRVFAVDILRLDVVPVKVQRWGVPGVDQPDFETRDPGRPFRILFLGILGIRKGVPELLEALRILKDDHVEFSCLLAGDGDLEHFKAQAEALQISDVVEMPGWLERAEVDAALRNSHCLVLPSRAEGLPVAVLEAFGNAVPVVSTLSGALGDILVSDMNALVVPEGDPVALANGLRRLVDSEDLRLSIARSGHALWKEQFAISDRAQEFAELWKNLDASSEG